MSTATGNSASTTPSGVARLPSWLTASRIAPRDNTRGGRREIEGAIRGKRARKSGLRLLGFGGLGRAVDALFPVAVDTLYSYRVPRGLSLAPGDFVSAPLGTRTSTGVVWAVREGDGGNLKSITAKRDWPPLKAAMRDFIDWVARWTLTPRGMALRMDARP